MIQYIYRSFIHPSNHSCLFVNRLILILSLEPLHHNETEGSHHVHSPGERDADLEDVCTGPPEHLDGIRVQRKRNGHGDQSDWGGGNPNYCQRVREVFESDDLREQRSQCREKYSAQNALDMLYKHGMKPYATLDWVLTLINAKKMRRP